MPTQADRRIAVKSPLGEDVLLFRAMSTTERLGRLFEYELDVLSTDDSIKLEDLLGKNVTVSLAMPDDEKRYFNGFVSRFAQAGAVGDLTWYQVTLRPWLWFLTRTSDCRIFQDKKVPEILKQIFKEYGFSDLDDQLKGSYRKWVYCVQYRETDFNFVSRLMEQEGIYYYFTHADGKHTLVLADAPGAHSKIPEQEVPYFQPTEAVVDKEDSVHDWHISQEIQPAKYSLTDYDFEKPKASLEVKKSVSPKHKEQADYEIYDYPGEYVETAEGDTYVKARIEELSAQYELARGAGNVRGMYVGGLFKLIDHPRGDQNREYLLVSCSHEMRTNEYESGGAVVETSYSCSFAAIESKVQYRSARVTPKPIIQGPQTAVVVGPEGEEIYTDKYGRVKVHFHWDREDKKDENSSCWIRVAQVWAGGQWGGIHIPRMKQEVIVEFLEGDPDRPIITGRVYNADQMPPYELPANMTQSGLKSRSTKGGADANFNEFRFEDKKGEEQVYLHAEKNQDIMVEHDETHTVGNDRTKDVKHDEKTTIGNDRTESVGNDESITITGNRTESVGKDETITIDGNRTESVGKDETITIDGNRMETVSKDETISITGNRTETVEKDESITITGNRTEDVTKKETVTIGDDRSHSVGKNDQLQVAKSLVIDAGDSVSIVTGSASINMKKDGTITIKGKDITIEGSGKINIKADGDITMKGSAIKQN